MARGARHGPIPECRSKRRRAGEQAERVANGTAKKIPGKHFMTNAANQKGQAAAEKFMSTAVPIIAKINAKAAA